jgi:hypothetical protein
MAKQDAGKKACGSAEVGLIIKHDLGEVVAGPYGVHD